MPSPMGPTHLGGSLLGVKGGALASDQLHVHVQRRGDALQGVGFKDCRVLGHVQRRGDALHRGVPNPKFVGVGPTP